MLQWYKRLDDTAMPAKKSDKLARYFEICCKGDPTPPVIDATPPLPQQANAGLEDEMPPLPHQDSATRGDEAADVSARREDDDTFLEELADPFPQQHTATHQDEAADAATGGDNEANLQDVPKCSTGNDGASSEVFVRQMLMEEV